MNRREFVKSVCIALLGSVGIVLTSGGCIAPRVSPTVFDEKSQPWRCEYCGHLTRSDRHLTGTRCPRCKRKGGMKRISEKELERYLKLQ